MAIRITIAMPADAVARMREKLQDGSPETEEFKRKLDIIGVEFPEGDNDDKVEIQTRTERRIPSLPPFIDLARR